MYAVQVRAQETRQSKISMALALGAQVYEDSAGLCFAIWEHKPEKHANGGFEIACVPPDWAEMKPAGRPPINGETMEVYQCRFTPAQMEKIRERGGAEYLRRLIDADA